MFQRKKDSAKGLLLYKGKWPTKGGFEIYSDGTIEISNGVTSDGIAIPKMVIKFLKLSKMKDKKIVTTWRIRLGEGTIKNIKGTIIRSNKSYYIQPIENGSFEVRYGKATCIAKIDKKYHKEYFNKLSQLRKSTKLEPKENLEAIIAGGEKNVKFMLYKNSSDQLFIHSKVSKHGNTILLSDELARYIENWHKEQYEHYICSINDQQVMVLKAKTRPGNREGRFFKELFIHNHDIPKESTIIITSKRFKLSEQAKSDLALLEQLQQAGFSIKKLTSNWTTKERHKNLYFVRNVWTIIGQTFTQKNSKVLSEVKVTSSTKQELTKRVDGLLVCEDILGIIEIKSSENIKNNTLDEVIGELALLQEHIGDKKSFIMLFINTEVIASKLKKNITKLYGLEHNIILIGKGELNDLLENPMRLFGRVKEFFHLQTEKSSKLQIFHPTDLTLTSKGALERQANDLLKQLFTNTKNSKSLIEQYCFLMNIEKSDFFKLYKLLNTQQGRKSPCGDELSVRRMLSSKHIFDFETLQQLHSELSYNGNYRILEEKGKDACFTEDYNILLRNWNAIKDSLPPMCRILQFKTLRTKNGSVFERQIRKCLESEGYQVVSNVLLSLHGKHFEIDHLAFKNGTMLTTSCKDRSNFQYTPNLYSKISFAFGQLALYRRIFNNTNGKLFVRVKKGNQKKLQKRYNNTSTADYSLIITE